MPNICPQCGAQQPPDAARCTVCGASMVPSEDIASQFTRQDIMGYSAYVIFLLLVALGIPCLVGLVCILTGR